MKVTLICECEVCGKGFVGQEDGPNSHHLSVYDVLMGGKHGYQSKTFLFPIGNPGKWACADCKAKYDAMVAEQEAERKAYLNPKTV